MAQTLLLKRSAVAGNVPTTSQMQLGEVGINTYDGRMFILQNNGTAQIVEIANRPYTDATYVFANSSITAGTATKITYDSKGLITSATTLSASDIPSLPWSKITSGTPTTLAGYGITDGALLASPAFTGTPTAPTAATSTNSTQLATTAYVKSQGYITGITASGDVSGTSSGNAITLTLGTSGVTAGTYGSGGAIPVITVDASGRVTSATTTSAASSGITLIGDISGTGSTGSSITTTLATQTGLTAGAYGSASQIPVVTVDVKGRVTAISTVSTGSSSINLIGDVTGTGTTGSSLTVTLDTVNSNVGTFGSTSQVGTFTVNAKGLITSASNTTLTVEGLSDVNVSSIANNEVLVWNSGTSKWVNSPVPAGYNNFQTLTPSSATAGLYSYTQGFQTIGGSAYIITGSTRYVLVLPDTTTTAVGTSLKFFMAADTNTWGGGGNFIVPNPANGAVYINLLGSNQGGLKLQYGETLEVALNANGNWEIIGGSYIQRFEQTDLLALSLNASGVVSGQTVNAGVGGITNNGNSYLNGNVIINFHSNSGNYAVANVQLGSGSTPASLYYDGANLDIMPQGYVNITSNTGQTLYINGTSITSMFAPFASPAFTGTPTAPTASALDASTKIATTAYVDSAVSVAKTAVAGGMTYQGTWNASTNTPTLASGTGTKGYYYIVATAGTTSIVTQTGTVNSWAVGDMIVYDGTNWDKVNGVPTEVSSVAGRVGAITLSVSDVSGAAPLASPSLTGTPTAPTPSSSDNSTTLATTAFVATALSSYGTTLQAITNVGATTSNAMSITNSTASTSTSTGALVVTGGVGVGGTVTATNLNVSGNITASGTLAAVGTTYLFGAATLSAGGTSITPATSDDSTNIATTEYVQRNLLSYLNTTSNTDYTLTNGDISSAALTTSTTAAGQVVDSVPSTTYRTVKYLIQVTSGSAYQASEILVIHDGTTPTISEYGQVFTGAVLATFDATISGGILQLIVTPVNAVTTIKVIRNGINI